MRKVRVKKLSPVANPDAPTPDWDEYVPGTMNGFVSLPVDYTLEGTEAKEPTINEVYMIARTKRNDVETVGRFTSSLVTEVIRKPDGTQIVKTKNSIYIVEEIK
jgi:hypothetical protein